ncbi:MAG: phosphatase PAP2 family protein [Candidatus Abyssobacteria bacterium SURF_5]|uniref:Phosphatase PAP2 family protein n=1 Tax=Abyssobacteria bacterium (strain SURF_5) TaxID=2093360 RepID=A0A3A4N7B0_ABYX5|nr:MAG: phosphatase PAP2 family protein [Candidatus Abyssubacteria bacterium SURF_5]
MIQRRYNLNYSLATAVGAIVLVIVLGALMKQYHILAPANVAAFQFVKSIQSLPLTIVMTVITWFGDAMGLMIFISVVFWLGYATEIVIFMLMVMFGSAISEHLKEAFDLHRPVSSEIPVIGKAKGYGYPSGHSQSGMYYAWLLYAFIGKYWPLCLIPALVLAFSRIYLGVHYFSDTVGGLLLGFGIVAGAMGTYSHLGGLEHFQNSVRQSPIARTIVAIALSVVYLFVAWGQADAFKYGGFLLGFFLIYPALGFRWRARNPFFAVIASVIGLAVLLAIQVFGAMKLPDTNFVDYLTYFVQGIVLAVSPLVFLKMRLLRRINEEQKTGESPEPSEKEKVEQPTEV